MSKLAERKAAAVTPHKPVGGTAPASALARAIKEGAQRGRDVEIPGLGPAHIRLVGQREAERIDLEVLAFMRDHELELGPETVNRFESAKAVRYLAAAVREADGVTPFGSLAEWQELDESLINAAWHCYGDVSEQLDPTAVDGVTPGQLVMIRDAISKKNWTLLRSFGVNTLASYMLSTDVQPLIAQMPRSTFSPSLSEPSDTATEATSPLETTIDAS